MNKLPSLFKHKLHETQNIMMGVYLTVEKSFEVSLINFSQISKIRSVNRPRTGFEGLLRMIDLKTYLEVFACKSGADGQVQTGRDEENKRTHKKRTHKLHTN